MLTSSEHWGKTFELAGDEAYTLAELAAEALSTVIGRPTTPLAEGVKVVLS